MSDMDQASQDFLDGYADGLEHSVAHLKPGDKLPNGLVVVPVEPTEAMWIAGREPILYRDSKAPPEMVTAEPWFRAGEDQPPRADGHAPKGDTAVWVYRAMLAAAAETGEKDT